MLRAAQFIAGSLSLVLIACAGAPSRDAQLTEQLLGKWSDVRLLECCDRMEQTIEFKKDGTFRVVGVRRSSKGSTPYSFSGTWKVKDGYLWYGITAAEPRELHAVGEERRDRILSVAEWEWVMVEQGTGRESRAWRYPK